MVLRSYGDKRPELGRDVFVDESAQVIGDVRLEDESSVWPGTVIRADDDSVRIGEGTAVMDLAFVEAPEGRPVEVGPGCIVSHCASLHGCSIGSGVLVGVGAIVLDAADVGDGCVIASGALVTPGTVIPAASVVMGMPGKVVRSVEPSAADDLARELLTIRRKARAYMGSHR